MHIIKDTAQPYMFSGNGYLDGIAHAMNASASGLVSKPFRKEKMRPYIDDRALTRQGHHA